jgi:hypothetical protein
MSKTTANEGTTPQETVNASPNPSTEEGGLTSTSFATSPVVGATEEGGVTPGIAKVQERIKDSMEKGYLGTTPDPTPNENYTASGVAQGLPTPETDAVLRAEANEWRTQLTREPTNEELRAKLAERDAYLNTRSDKGERIN